MFDRTAYNKQYRKDKLKRVSFDVQKEYYETIKEHAVNRSETVNGFIKRAIDETMERDRSGSSGKQTTAPE